MHRRIVISDIIKVMIVIAMLVALSIVKVLGGIFDHPNYVKLIIFFFFLIAIILMCFYRFPESKIIYSTIIIIAMICVCSWVRAKIDWYEFWRSMIDYMFVIGAIPIYFLISTGRWQFDKFLKTIVNLTMISYGIRIYISLYERSKGDILWKSIALEAASDNWYRNGMLRINPPCFGNIIIPVTFYLLVSCKGKLEKIYYIFVIILATAYSYNIHGARSLLIYNTIEIVFVILYYKKTTWKQMTVFILLSILLVIVVNSTFFNTFLKSFYITSSEAYSTRSRLVALRYYIDLWKRNLVLGQGVMSQEKRYISILTPSGVVTGTLADIGILFTLVRFGFGGIAFYIVYYVSMIVSGFRCRKNCNNNLDVLVLGIALSIFITGINIDNFFSIYAVSVPFVIAITAYSYKTSVEYENLNRIEKEGVSNDLRQAV